MSRIALGHTWRIQAFNRTGAQLDSGDITVQARLVKFDSNGALSFASESTPLSLGTTLDNDTYLSGSSQDNSTNKYLGAEFEVFSDTTGETVSMAGDEAVIFWFQTSTDGGTTWPDNGTGIQIAYHDHQTAGSHRTQASI